jgi:hypothetical protein
MNNLIRQNDNEFQVRSDYLTLLYDGSWYKAEESPVFNTEKVTVPRLSKDGKDL